MTDIRSPDAETTRIIRSGTVWLAAVVIAAALLLAAAVDSGWRPTDLEQPWYAVWWFGASLATVGTALLMWAGCPTLGFTVEQAYRQKRRSIRAGISLSLIGMALGALAVLATPAG